MAPTAPLDGGCRGGNSLRHPPEKAAGAASVGAVEIAFAPGEGAAADDVSPLPVSPALASPTAVHKDDRKVSWGLQQPVLPPDPANAGGRGSGGSSPSRPPPPAPRGGSRRLDLAALRGAGPLETEAEAHLQRTLDERDPTEGGAGVPVAILGHDRLPLETPPETFGGLAAGVEGPSYAAKPAKTGSKRSIGTTAEHLFHLAADLRLLHLPHGGGTSPTDAGAAAAAKDPLLAARPHRLVRRTTKNDTPVTPRWNGDLPAVTAADRWSLLRRKVRAHALPTEEEEEQAAAPVRQDTDDTQAEDPLGTDRHPHWSDSVKKEASESAPLRRSLSQVQKSREAVSRFRRQTRGKVAVGHIKHHYEELGDWLQVRRLTVVSYIKNILLYVILPATGLASILFYAADNPRLGSQPNEQALKATVVYNVSSDKSDVPLGAEVTTVLTGVLQRASWSWWILFVFVRQVLTLSLSLATQALIIDFMILRSKTFVHLFGSFITLFVVQAKGWPFVVFMWSVYDFAFLYGGRPWTEHWLWWQNTIDMMNANNPSGGATESSEYLTLLTIMLLVSFVVMLKRFWLCLFLGRQTYVRYGQELAKVMRKALLIGQVAALARDKEELGLDMKNDFSIDLHEEYAPLVKDENSATKENEAVSPRSLPSQQTFVKLRSLSGLQKSKVDQLLGEWEEPVVVREIEEVIPIAAIIQFRQSLTYLSTSRPFGTAFGVASTRTECIQSSEVVYGRLIGQSSVLNFDVIALLAVEDDSEMDDEKLKELIRLFRPDRDGNLSLLDFAKSVDSAYKELRLLRAAVANSSKIDRAFEHIVNVFFYFLVLLCILAGVGVAPGTVISPIGAFVVGLGFMIGSASSKYLEGILFILVRRPYDIGDRIHISDPLRDTSVTGSPAWIVKDLNLYSTTVIYASTNEEGTYSNASLASSRVLNLARSINAQVSLTIKFPIDAPYEKLMAFKKCLQKFILSRPREFSSFVAFRATRLEVDLGYVEYIVYALHRESWQEGPTIAQSKADLGSFALELSKKMNLRYRSPPMPVDLSINKPGSGAATTAVADDEEAEALQEVLGTVESFDANSITEMFEPRRN